MVDSNTRTTTLNFGGLDENAEVIGGENYIGELPPAGKALPGIIRRVYVTESNFGDPILKVLYEVTEGPYTGFVAWDNVTLNNAAAFKWQPFCRVLGITVNELKTKTVIDADNTTQINDKHANRVLKIGARDLSGNDGVPCYFGVQYKNYQDVRTPNVAGSKPRQVASNDALNEFKSDAGNGNGKQKGREKVSATAGDPEDFIHE